MRTGCPIEKTVRAIRPKAFYPFMDGSRGHSKLCSDGTSGVAIVNYAADNKRSAVKACAGVGVELHGGNPSVIRHSRAETDRERDSEGGPRARMTAFGP